VRRSLCTVHNFICLSSELCEWLLVRVLETALSIAAVVLAKSHLLASTATNSSVSTGTSSKICPGLLLLSVGTSFLRISILFSSHELKSFSILHGGLILDGLSMLLVVEGDVDRIQTQQVAHLVRNPGPHLLVATIFDPNLKKSFFCPQRKTQANDFGLFELFADQG